MSRAVDRPSSDAAPGRATDNTSGDLVDVSALAEKVYQLMLAEARLELARGGCLRRRED
jgi:hypothetical protein